jgi:minor extracellular serine protease Vpr
MITTLTQKIAKQIKLVSVVVLIFSIFGCDKKLQPNSNQPALIADVQNIISTRPQNQDTIMAILKLKSPALLENATRRGGKTEINQDLLKTIQDEQATAIAALKAISSEVQVLFRYKMVLNAVVVLAPKADFEKLQKVGFIATFEEVTNFARPLAVQINSASSTLSINERNSLKFIGAEKLNQMGITGKGMKVGVLDTGIDYTHAMFGGVGTEEAYKAIDPAKEATGFPSAKVVGGIDLVGTTYDSASPAFSFRIPKPDMNPLDEGGHGTHVSGTIAGHGDGVDSYNGMAPDALLYGIKVFGAEGSTSDMIVIAGLEFAADPNGDNDLGDQLDVVNLSLGSSYGNPKILYAEALKNLVRGGTVAVISAGNSGAKDYIVGSPGTATEALSVAASIDDGDQNWKFDSSEIILNGTVTNVEAVEAVSTKPIKDAPVLGKLVAIGLANEDLSDELKAAVKGNVAFIDRGVVTFNEKVKRAAAAGAIGVVLANHSDGAPFRMGTTDPFDIPAIMVTKQVGQAVKVALAAGQEALVRFQGTLKIEKPELIDQLTDFSSKGPRSIDGYLKPEISAPGNNVISASMGKGAQVVQMSGTSMAAPHMAGVMALVKQAMVEKGADLSALELKNVVMGTSKTIGDTEGRYAITRQGAGRVQADKAATAQVVANTPSVSFGEVSIESKKSVRSKLTLKNISGQDLVLTVSFEGNEFMTMNPVADVAIAKSESAELTFVFNLDSSKMGADFVREMDGWVKFSVGGAEAYRIPVLAVAHKLSSLTASQFKIAATSKIDADGALATLSLINSSANSGEAMLFNLVGVDERKPMALPFMNADCDLQAVGYKIIERKDEDGQSQKIVQFAIKTYQPLTTWNACDVSILIDSDKDGVVEQELLGASLKSIPNQISEDFVSTLLDAEKTRELRKSFEQKIAAVLADSDITDKSSELDKLKSAEKYDEAIIDQQEMTIFNNSTIVLVEAALDMLSVASDGSVSFQVVTSQNEQNTTQLDDFLKIDDPQFQISTRVEDQPFYDLGEAISVAGLQSKSVELIKGAKEGKILALFPHNRFSFSNNIMDDQAQVLVPTFGFGK